MVILLLIPCSEIVTQIVQFILNEVVKTKADSKNGLSKWDTKEKNNNGCYTDNSENKKKVKELMKKVRNFLYSK